MIRNRDSRLSCRNQPVGEDMRFTKSLSFSISLLLIVIVTLLVALLFYNNLYAMNVVRNQVVQSYRDLLPRYVEKQDDALSEIQNYLIRTLNHTAENADIRNYNSYPKNSDTYFLSASNLFLRLSRDINSYAYADILFVYSERNESIVSFSSDAAREIPDIDNMLRASVAISSAVFTTSRWQITRLNGVPGLMCMSSDGAGSYMGAWVNLNRLLNAKTFSDEDSSRGMIVISGDRHTYIGTENLKNLNRLVALAENFFEGTPQTVMAPGSTLRYLLIAEKSKKTDLYFIEAIEERTLLNNLPSFQIMIYILPVVMIILFILYLAFLQRIIIMPIHSLTRGMGAISRGNMKVMLPEIGAEEIRFVIRSFNEMVSQIETLRIDVYEKQLQTQQADIETKKAELRSMQLQINPHFFANSLNIIYSLSAIRDYQTIQKMALLLSRYFRYIMLSAEGLTELRNEVSFVRDYLEIQKLRFTKRLHFTISMDPRCEIFLIPPLTIQPFVENAIVHGFTDPVKGLDIKVEIEPEASGGPDDFTIRISDNGKGFSEAQLEAFSDPGSIQAGSYSHIGIWNVQSRLTMTYGKTASLHLTNCPEGGACILIRLSAKVALPSPIPAMTAEPQEMSR